MKRRSETSNESNQTPQKQTPKNTCEYYRDVVKRGDFVKLNPYSDDFYAGDNYTGGGSTWGIYISRVDYQAVIENEEGDRRLERFNDIKEILYAAPVVNTSGDLGPF